MRRDYRTGEEIDSEESEETDEYEYSADEDEDESSVEHKEKPQEKIKKQKQQYQEQKDNGEVKTQGFYIFYRIFKFIGGLSLFIAVGCLAYLIYLFYMLVTKPAANPARNEREDQNLLG